MQLPSDLADLTQAPPKILVVDDNIQNIELLDGLLSSRGYAVIKAYNGAEALRKVEETPPHMILLDVLMPGMDGYEVCRRLKTQESTRLVPVVMLTALNSLEDRVRGIDAGADDFIAKPFQKLELLARVKSLIRVKGLLDQLEGAQNVLLSLAIVLDFNDPYTHGHSQRVSENGARLAAFMGLPEAEQKRIRFGGILHDIGKVATEKNVLHKQGALNGQEYEHIKLHPVVGEKICQPLQFAKPLLPIIRGHHEKFNGKGYPDGLAGEEIPLGCKIIGIVDAYDALITVRPYRDSLAHETAIDVIKSESVKGYWDPEIVSLLCGMFKSERMGHKVAAC